MAEHLATDAQADADFEERVRTYNLFRNLFKFGLLTVVIILIFLAVVTL
ncbi:MAG TPA: aa3-type cytochrome c oxidase subunit IV [Methylovirgula sp.]|nr:aa3-type cytochrome c oxidase subunit IV [Methylovirgula sp.]